MERKTKKTLQTIVLLIIIVILIVIYGWFALQRKQQQITPSPEVAAQSQAIEETIRWNGKSYIYNKNLENILLMGIDNDDTIDAYSFVGQAGQSDCIMILSLDKQLHTGRILQINRNTITEIDIYDLSGHKTDVMDAQLTLQYAYSTGGANSCIAMKKTVRELLYGVPIDGFFAMNLEGVEVINDALGGVNVEMEDDYTNIDPAFEKGKTIHLTGSQAQRFIRYRDTDVFNSVADRMKRQTAYITAMVTSLKGQGSQKLYDVLEPFMGEQIITDLNVEQLNGLTSYEYLTDQVEELPGETKMGDIYEEYYVDDAELQDLIFDMFYTEVTE